MAASPTIADANKRIRLALDPELTNTSRHPGRFSVWAVVRDTGPHGFPADVWWFTMESGERSAVEYARHLNATGGNAFAARLAVTVEERR